MCERVEYSDELFEEILKKGIELYVEKIENEPMPELSPEEQAMADSMKDRIYKNLMKQIRREERHQKMEKIKKFIISRKKKMHLVLRRRF